jgi:O-glycosyl hydrolase
VTINLAGVQQRISGFGVSSAWAGNFNDPAKDPDTLWSTTTATAWSYVSIFASHE